MPVYNYKALDRAGREVSGALEAPSPEAAKSSLRAAGYLLLALREKHAARRHVDLPLLGAPKPKDMAVFCRQFVSLLRAGVPIAEVLGLLAQQTENDALAAAVHELHANVEKGESLAAAMARHPRIFRRMAVSMVAAGEMSGALEDSFRQMALFYERSAKTRTAVGKAMAYPCVLLAVTLAVLVVMMTRIVPMFLETLSDMGAELPALTRAVVAVSGWFTAHWLLLASFLLLLAVGSLLLRRTSGGRHFFDLLARRAPLFGRMTTRSACASFCRTLSVLLGAGLPLTDSLDLTAANMMNIWYADAARAVRGMVSEGWSLAAALRETRLFPPTVCNLAGIGEESGDLRGMLARTADYYDEEVESATQRLLALLEPTVILIMAVIVVLIVFSIFLPMLDMTAAYDQYL